MDHFNENLKRALVTSLIGKSEYHETQINAKDLFEAVNSVFTDELDLRHVQSVNHAISALSDEIAKIAGEDRKDDARKCAMKVYALWHAESGDSANKPKEKRQRSPLSRAAGWFSGLAGII
jgi:uncharacterized small protein (DUF1192 family)